MSKNKLYEVQADVFVDLRNLLTLDLSSNNIELLQPPAFDRLGELQQLKLNSNFLVSVAATLFKVLKNLRGLFLQNNNLKFISANLMSPMTQLVSVDFRSNDCISMSHPNESLVRIEQEIIINCVAPIQLNCIFDNEAIFISKSLNISSYMCKAVLTVIDPKTKISKINGIQKGTQGVEDVTDFLAINQSMKFFPFELAQNLPRLELILVERSNLLALQKEDFEGFAWLKSIIIRHNNLNSIDEGIFDNVTQLEILDLSSNFIRLLPVKLFSKLINLKTLILSHNLIKKLSADLLNTRKKCYRRVQS